MFKTSKVSAVIILILLPLTFKAQNTPALGTWNILHIKGNIYKNILFFTEAQLRSQGFYNKLYYYELKAAAGYRLNNNISFMAGGGHYETYASSGNFVRPATTKEWRTWVEMNMVQNIDRLILDQRYRIEQRWINTLGYRNRFRCRFSLMLPINKKNIENKTLYIIAGDEPFLGSIAPYFERNRIFAGLGYRFSNLVLQTMWFNQYEYKLTGDTEKNFFQMSAMVTIGGKPKVHTVPSNGD